MFQRIKNIIRSWSTDENNHDHELLIIHEMQQGLSESQNAIAALRDQLLQHEQNIVSLEKEKGIYENEGKKLLRNNHKAQAEITIAKMYRTEERLNHLRTIYTELSSSLGDLENNKQKLEYKISQFKNKKLVIKAKTLSANNELEVIKGIAELEDLNELEVMEDKLIEAQCLAEAFRSVNNHEPASTNDTVPLENLEAKINKEEKAKEAAALDRIAQMMGGNIENGQKNEEARAKILAIKKKFEENIQQINNKTQQELLEKWIKESKNTEERHHDKISEFFKSSNDDIIDKFFN